MIEVYIVNGICYAEKLQEGIKVTEVKPLSGRMLLVTFSTGEKRLFDTTRLEGSAFDILEDKNIFNNPEVFRGVITWDEAEWISRRKRFIRRVFLMKIK